uniref:C-type lectin domain-containing protein n=1 Tax=Acrobeloides nanus TaxID=290746 RepID=A0A914CP51_9BILA
MYTSCALMSIFFGLLYADTLPSDTLPPLVDVYKNEYQPCQSNITFDIPNDQKYYQLLLFTPIALNTWNQSFYLWGLPLQRTPMASYVQHYLITDSYTWHEARELCTNKYGGYLKDVMNAADAARLKSLGGNNEYWIGLSDFEQTGVYAWDRGLNQTMQVLNTSGFNQWPGGKVPPYDSNKQCVRMTKNQTWALADCNQKLPFLICQRDANPLPTKKYYIYDQNCFGGTYNITIKVSPQVWGLN